MSLQTALNGQSRAGTACGERDVGLGGEYIGIPDGLKRTVQRKRGVGGVVERGVIGYQWTSSQQLQHFGNNGLHPVTLYPSRLGRWRIHGHCSRISSFLFPFSFRAPRRLAPQCGSSCGLLCLSASPCAPLPVSSLPCLRSDTFWLVLWVVTVPQGPCQLFVLRESAGLAFFVL